MILVPSTFSAKQIYATVSESRAEGEFKASCLRGKADIYIYSHLRNNEFSMQVHGKSSFLLSLVHTQKD